VKNIKQAALGRFESTLSVQKEEQIRNLLTDSSLTLPQIAKKAGVSLDTILKRKGARTSVREAQIKYFQILKKEYVLPIVKEMAFGLRVVSAAEVLRILSQKYRGKFSRDLVSKAIEELAAEGLKFERPREYYEALELAKRKNSEWKEVDELILQFRKKAPEFGLEQMLEGINGVLVGKKISHNSLRSRITYLYHKKVLPRAKRKRGK